MSNEPIDKNTEDIFAKQVLFRVSDYIGSANYIEVKKRLIKVPDAFGGTREKLIKPKILKIYAKPDYILIEKMIRSKMKTISLFSM